MIILSRPRSCLNNLHWSFGSRRAQRLPWCALNQTAPSYSCPTCSFVSIITIILTAIIQDKWTSIDNPTQFLFVVFVAALFCLGLSVCLRVCLYTRPSSHSFTAVIIPSKAICMAVCVSMATSFTILVPKVNMNMFYLHTHCPNLCISINQNCFMWNKWLNQPSRLSTNTILNGK